MLKDYSVFIRITKAKYAGKRKRKTPLDQPDDQGVFWLIPNLLQKQIKQGGGGVSRQQGRKRSFLKTKLTGEDYNNIKLILFLINFPMRQSFS